LLVVADEDEAAERAAGTSVVGPGRMRACSAVAIDQVVLTDRDLKLFGKPAAQLLHRVDDVDAERTAEQVLPRPQHVHLVNADLRGVVATLHAAVIRWQPRHLDAECTYTQRLEKQQIALVTTLKT